MDVKYTGKEKRQFLRYSYKKPLHCSIITSPKERNPISSLIKAVSKNLSASGIFFVTNAEEVPDVSSLVMLDLDYRTAHFCREIER